MKKTCLFCQGMNYMAGFLLATITDAVVSERDSGDRGYRVANGVNSQPSGASAGGADGGTLASELQEAVVREAVSRKWEGKAAEPMGEEKEVIETECVQVMLGMIALQGGILSRDLWGLHAVRRWRQPDRLHFLCMLRLIYSCVGGTVCEVGRG